MRALLLLILFISADLFYPQNLFRNPDAVTRELNNYLQSYYSTRTIPSVSAGVLYNGKIVWQNALGFADIENNVQATPNSVYRIASISKSITAVAVMQLVEQKKISLDEDIRKYVPYYPAKKWKITPRQLLSHTAGIRNYKPGEFDSKDYFVSTREAVDVIKDDSLLFEPGTKYAYTTLGYNLLAAAVENVSNLSFADYLNENIFKPAGMISTVPEFQKQIVMNRAKGYGKNLYRQIENAPLADLSIKFAGGGIISTSGDLLRFADGIISGKLIKRATLDSMLVPTVLKNGDTLTYGLGIESRIDSKGRRVFSHAGGGTGFVSLLLVYPDVQLASVHLINIRDRNLMNPAQELASIVLRQKYEKPRISLADTMLSIYLNSTNLNAVTEFYEAAKNDTIKYTPDLRSETVLFGYDLIYISRTADAVTFFKFITAKFPDHLKAYIGLADAYIKDGNKGLALKAFRTALKLDPSNKYAAQMIKKINGT